MGRASSSVLPYDKWNVTPLLGNFGGSVGIYRFLQTAMSAGTWVKCKKREKIPTNKERGEIQGI